MERDCELPLAAFVELSREDLETVIKIRGEFVDYLGRRKLQEKLGVGFGAGVKIYVAEKIDIS